jgi:predicted phosphodiesterase
MAQSLVSKIINDLNFAYSQDNNLDLNIDAHNDRVIIFSDLHRGNGGLNDDFRHCNETYKNALRYYRDNDYRLILLGDVEELWENIRFERIYNRYPATYALEKDFFTNDKNSPGNPYYIRCFGNHDYRYAYPEFVSPDLEAIAGLNGIQVYEGIKMNISNNENPVTQIYLSHGHQGHYKRNLSTTHSVAVELFGLIQSVTGTPTNRSYMLEPPLLKPMRRATNRAYLKWGHQKGIPVIYGHTHEPVFNSRTVRNGALIDITDDNGIKISSQNAFNTGCCSFMNGEITGIEIRDNSLKLILWSPNAVGPPGVISSVDIDQLVTNL